MAYGINFNDGHAEIRKILDTPNWTALNPTAGIKDWTWLKDRTTHPL
jgi:hypothetical protein